MQIIISERATQQNQIQQSSGIPNDPMDDFESKLTLAKIKSMEENMSNNNQIDKDEYQAKKKGQEFLRRKSLVPDDKMTVVLVGDMVCLYICDTCEFVIQ